VLPRKERNSLVTPATPEAPLATASWTMRVTFVFTPKHGSWLNLVEGFFSKLARSTLRHIRVASKKELKDRIITAIDDINRDPVVHTWTYKINDVA
jgi:transposase